MPNHITNIVTFKGGPVFVKRLRDAIAGSEEAIDFERIIPKPKELDIAADGRGLIKMMDDGLLVRDISGDGASGWAIKQLPLVIAVKAATEAIAKATEK